MDVGRHGCRTHTGLEIKLASNYKPLLSLSFSRSTRSLISSNAEARFLFQALPLWYVMHAYVTLHNAHTATSPPKTRFPLHPHRPPMSVILMRATDGLSAYSAYVAYTSYKPPPPWHRSCRGCVGDPVT